jgi:chromosome segregation ATPase
MLKADRVKLLGELKNLECDHDSVNRKLADLEKYLATLEADGKAYRDKILQYENDNNSLDDTINEAERDLDNLERSIIEAQKQLKDLQTSLATLAATNNKFKTEASHFQKAMQTEILRNTDIAKSLSQAENTLRARDGQIGVATK